MAKENNFYNSNKIVRRYRFKQFSEIPPWKLVDIVHGIVEGKIADENILKSWEDHFRSMKIPYVIMLESGRKTLWKELVV